MNRKSVLTTVLCFTFAAPVFAQGAGAGGGAAAGSAASSRRHHWNGRRCNNVDRRNTQFILLAKTSATPNKSSNYFDPGSPATNAAAPNGNNSGSTAYPSGVTTGAASTPTTNNNSTSSRVGSPTAGQAQQNGAVGHSANGLPIGSTGSRPGVLRNSQSTAVATKPSFALHLRHAFVTDPWCMHAQIADYEEMSIGF